MCKFGRRPVDGQQTFRGDSSMARGPVGCCARSAGSRRGAALPHLLGHDGRCSSNKMRPRLLRGVHQVCAPPQEGMPIVSRTCWLAERAARCGSKRCAAAQAARAERFSSRAIFEQSDSAAERFSSSACTACRAICRAICMRDSDFQAPSGR